MTGGTPGGKFGGAFAEEHHTSCEREYTILKHVSNIGLHTQESKHVKDSEHKITIYFISSAQNQCPMQPHVK